MQPMIAHLASGMLLGLACGLAPGPLLALVVAQTLRHGAGEGCRVAFAPLLTDAPIIAVALVFAARLAGFGPWLGIVSLAGGVFVLFLAWDTVRPPRLESWAENQLPQSWFKGILTNLLSPHPWLFWLTVGAATLAKAMAQSWLAALAFLCGFYLLLVGSKVLLALLVARSRAVLAGRPYRVVLCLLGVLLGFFAVLLFREGLKSLAVLWQPV
jgi:threonine/homoserine/homoserine lactone efflux protein